MKKKLSQREINNLAEEIYEILSYIPLFYIDEILELAKEGREKEGEHPDMDVSSDSDENGSDASETSNP